MYRTDIYKKLIRKDHSMKKINWGILATGKIAETVAKAMKFLESDSNNNMELLAVASRSQDKSTDFVKRHNIKRAYGSYEELVSDPDIDVVYIATPMSCHYENVKLCLNASKNVLCEKSVCLCADEFEELMDLAKDKGLFLMEAMWMKFLPAFNKAKEWAEKGLIGNIKMIKADFSNAVSYDENDRLFINSLGGGAILDLGVYPITFVCSFLGNRPEEIHTYSIKGRTDVDYDDSIILKYNEAYGITFCGFDFENENKAIIVGDKGRIVMGNWFFCTAEATLYDNMGNIIDKQVLPYMFNGYEFEILEVNKCLREGKLQSDIIPHSDTLDVMRIMETCLKQADVEYK